ncbi:hypothetical protein J6590_099930 [Homalodisca vitripennis]|nr:hypothetical protein J6590_099930 [Homalodisca vitripennis]
MKYPHYSTLYVALLCTQVVSDITRNSPPEYSERINYPTSNVAVQRSAALSNIDVII